MLKWSSDMCRTGALPTENKRVKKVKTLLFFAARGILYCQSVVFKTARNDRIFFEAFVLTQQVQMP